jgi:hypothetical protein
MASRLEASPRAKTGCLLCNKESRDRGRKLRAVKFDSGAVKCKNHPGKRANRSFYLATGGRYCASCLAHKADGSRKVRHKPDWELTIKPATSFTPVVQDEDGGLCFFDETSLLLWRVKATSPRAAREGTRQSIKAALWERILRDPFSKELIVLYPHGGVIPLETFLLAKYAEQCNTVPIPVVEPEVEELIRKEREDATLKEVAEFAAKQRKSEPQGSPATE